MPPRGAVQHRDGDVSIVTRLLSGDIVPTGAKLLKSLGKKLTKKGTIGTYEPFPNEDDHRAILEASDVVPKTSTKFARQKDGTQFRSFAAS